MKKAAFLIALIPTLGASTAYGEEQWVPAPGFEEEFKQDPRPTSPSEAFREGYSGPSREELDDKECRSYGLKPGWFFGSGYANCRLRLKEMRRR